MPNFREMQAPPDFAREVRPILERSCLRCHGPSQQRGGVRLDSRAAALRFIVPHKADASPLIQRIVERDDNQRMPPASSGLPRLTDKEVTTLKAWIDAGPSWPEATTRAKPKAEMHWSLKPLRRPSAPTTPGNPIDHFILAKLTAKGLGFSKAADRPTLLRRVSYDLTGLPPTPAEVDAFVADASPRAYEKVVDRLLASPRYGERWARHWLDTIHFADSHGFEHDVARDNAWPFRDYVISSLNQDTPWPRFIREQLAADFFFPDQPQLTPALGFLGAGTFDLSAYNTAPQNFELLDRDDLVTQTMAAFTSTTANCARCHDHKFDPIPQRDYYQLQAVFAGLVKGERTYQTAPQKPGPQWKPLTLESFVSEEGSELSRGPENTVLSGGKRPETDTYTTVATSPLRRITALRLDVLASDALPMRRPGRQDNGNLHLSELEVWAVAPGSDPHRVTFSAASADFNQDGWGIDRALDGDPKTAWGIFPEVGKDHFAVLTLTEPLMLSPETTLTVALKQLHGGGHLIGKYRLSVTEAPPAQLETAPRRVFAAGASVDVPTVGMRTITEPRPIFVLERGELDKPRERVEPGALSAVTALSPTFALKNPKNEAERRAALAEWLVAKENPLTWRSIVNRVWHYHFGRGLCDTPSDLGRMGGTPSHPELIDGLAVWFRDEAKGSLKKLHRLIVTSETYRQSTASRPEAAKRDTDNRLLWRQNVQRLDADSYRDFALAASGKLDLTMGGPGVKHFSTSPGRQLTPVLDYTSFNWDAPGAGRRSIYRYVWRGIADPFMEALDFPDLGLLAPTRTFSVSALQALTLYNNAFVLSCSEALAQRAPRPARLDSQVAFVVEQVWLRRPTAIEQKELTAFAQRHGLPALCRVLLNSNEFLFVN